MDERLRFAGGEAVFNLEPGGDTGQVDDDERPGLSVVGVGEQRLVVGRALVAARKDAKGGGVVVDLLEGVGDRGDAEADVQDDGEPAHEKHGLPVVHLQAGA